MTQQEKQERLLYAAGWGYSCRGGWGMVDSLEGPAGQTEQPDYFNDLNACHELEEILTEEQRQTYISNLHIYGSMDYQKREWYDLTHAPAEHRAETIGLTLNLWE